MIIQSYAAERIVLIWNEYNIGNNPSRNKGLDLAIGKYIRITDADDIAYAQRLDPHPDILAVGTLLLFYAGK